VLGHVPGQGHGQVETQPHGGVLLVQDLGLAHGVNLLEHVALGHQRVPALDSAGLQWREAEQPVLGFHGLDDALLDELLFWQPLAEAGDGE